MTETSSPLVSIVTPAFNAAAHLGETIESCLAQTHRDFELIIVNDGSTDATADVAAGYAAQDARIRLLSIPHRGVSRARNVAMSEARGPLLALLDSDDVWMPDYLDAQIATLNRYRSADVVTANAINYGGSRDGTAYWPASSGVRAITTVEMVTREDAVCVMSVFRRSMIERVGAFADGLAVNEDYEFWLRAAVLGCRFVADFTPRAYYRRQPGSASSDERRMLAGIITVLKHVRPLCPVDGAEVRSIDAQLNRFGRELLVAEACECLAKGDARGAVGFLQGIPDRERSVFLSVLLRMAPLWPSMLSYSYRLRRTFVRQDNRANSWPWRQRHEEDVLTVGRL